MVFICCAIFLNVILVFDLLLQFVILLALASFFLSFFVSLKKDYSAQIIAAYFLSA